LRHEPAFFAAEQIDKHQQGDGHLQVFLGSLQGISSSIPPAWPGLGAEFSLDPQGTMTLSVENEYEHAVLLDAGALTINGEALNQHELGYLAPGHHQIELSNITDLPARGLLLGGQPFEEEFVMWWNFIGRSHEEIEEFRNQWQASLSGERGPFGNLTHMSPLPAPEMPGVRLKARNRR
jgi:redox-sensitive bicupin YhaK (pirin superfamily)